MSSQTANDLIMGGGGPPVAKFPTPGTLVKGQIVDTATSQQTDFATGVPKTWKDGRPMLQAIITLQTDARDDQDDDGRRRLFIASRNMREAVRDAVLTAGAKELEVGGTLAVQYTGDGPSEGQGNPPKEYVAQYRLPAIGVDLLSGDQPQAVQRPTSLLG